MFTSYHSHSTWSDGGATASDMIAAAQAAGLAEYGLSDHFVLAPDGGKVDWSMDTDHVCDYVAEVQGESTRSAIPIRLGLEVDFFPDRVEVLSARIAEFPFDYVIGSIHYVDGFPVDSAVGDWEPLSQDEVNDVHRRYWALVGQLADSRLFDFVGHIDLPKKFAFLPSVDLTREIEEALDAIAATGMAVEINTAGWDKPCAEAYPSQAILRDCRARDIPVLINDDSHHPTQIGRHFRRAVDLLRSVGYQEVSRYTRRKRTAVPLDK